MEFMPPHVLDLKDGESCIGPHVDHKQASGHVISAISLISPCVLIFRHVESGQVHKVLVPPNSLYAQRYVLYLLLGCDAV